jgi:hypothetical protein
MSSEPIREETGATDKGKRLALMMSMGFGYFKAKKALEEHGWDVDDAIANMINSTGIDTKASATNETGTMSTKEATHAVMSSVAQNENPHLSPDHRNVKSLKRETRHSHKHFEQVQDATHSSPAAIETGDSPPTQTSAKQDPPGNTIEGHEYENDADESTTQEQSWVSFEKEKHVVSNEDVEEDIGRNANVARLTSTPAPFREGDDENSSAAWDSLMQDTISTKPYLAVAETISVPELVSTTLQPPAMSVVTSPIELAQLPSEDGIASNAEKEDQSAIERSYGGPTKRRSLQVIAVALLVFIGLVVGLSVSLMPNTESLSEPVAGRGSLTASPAPTSQRPEPSTSAPSLANSPTTEPSQSPADSQTLEPTTSTTPPTREPTTLPTPLSTMPPPTTPNTLPTSPTLRPTLTTEPPTVPVTDRPTPSPTSGLTIQPTVLPTVPPTVSPTREPTSPSTVSPTVIPTSSQPPQEDTQVEGAKMVLSGASRLDQDAMKAWIDVTAAFILKHVNQTLQEADSSYRIDVRILLSSQTETNNEELTLIFSVYFTIESSLGFHDAGEYVLEAFDDKDAYIKELQNSDSSFENVYDVSLVMP